MHGIWRPAAGYEGLYEVSDHGFVRSAKTGALKAPQQGEYRRLSVLLWKQGKARMVKIHRLVLLTFVGEPPPGWECCHNDGDASNNKLSNLRWDTTQNNQRDRAAHGTSNRGERCAAAKLTTEQVLAIRADTRLQREIAAEYGIRDSAVSRIKTRKRWAHIP